MGKETFQNFIHPALDEEVKTISGRYGFNKEERIAFGNREILYFTGYSVTDSSCCGTGGCAFCFVPGYISRWHYKADETGKPVSEVEPVKDETAKKELTRILTEREHCTQVNFL